MATASTIRYLSLSIGLVFAALTLGLEKIPERFIDLLVPGLIASMAVSGNAHAFPLWPAAVVNGLFYFGLAWVSAALLTKAVRRTKH